MADKTMSVSQAKALFNVLWNERDDLSTILRLQERVDWVENRRLPSIYHLRKLSVNLKSMLFLPEDGLKLLRGEEPKRLLDDITDLD